MQNPITVEPLVHINKTASLCPSGSECTYSFYIQGTRLGLAQALEGNNNAHQNAVAMQP